MTKGILIFFISAGWYSFFYGFLVLLYLFHHCFIVTRTNIHFIKCCFIKDLLWKYICCNRLYIIILAPPPSYTPEDRQAELRILEHLKYFFFFNLSCTLYISMYVQCTLWYIYFRPQIYDIFCGFLWTLGRKENHRPSPMDLKIQSLERNQQLWLDSWQSLELLPKLSLCDFHLWSLKMVTERNFLYDSH